MADTACAPTKNGIADPGGGGGGHLIFSSYVGSDPASTVHPPKNIKNFKHPKKIFEILAAQKNFPNLYLDLKKTLKCIEMTLKLAQFCDDPQNIHKIFIPPKNIHFSENPKNIEIQKFEPPKIARVYVCVKISEYPPPPDIRHAPKSF